MNVFGRVRPCADREDGAFVAVKADETAKRIFVDDGDAEQALRASFDRSSSGEKKEKKEYEFDSVFDGDSTQAEVFAGVGLPVLNAVLQGYHGCVFAYGQTGSGKTHTLLNSGQSSDGFRDAGLLPRLVATLFVRARMDAAHVYAVEVSSFQIYNEQVDDLLHPQGKEGGGTNLNVTRSSDGTGAVEGLTWIPTSSANALLELFAKARKMLIYAETKMNKASSRSHACFQLKVSRRPRHQGRGTVAILSVVDLAGSERTKRSGVEGKQFKEAVNINGSLLALGNVVAAMASRKKHVPFRDSKLTRLLEGRVGGNCRTNLIVCASPSADSVSESVSALAFAARAMRVETSAVVNEVDDVIPDADGLAVVPASHDAEKHEAEKKKSAEEAARALQLRQQAEQELQKERDEKEAILAKERKASELALSKTKKEAEALREKDRRAQEVKLEEEKSIVRRLSLEIDKEKEKVAKEKEKADNFKQKVEILEKQKKTTETALTVAEKEKTQAKQQVTTLQKELDKTTGDLQATKLAIDEEKRQRKLEREQLRAEKLAADNHIVDLGKQLDDIEKEALTTKKELTDAQSSLAALKATLESSSKQTAEELEAERRDHAEIRRQVEAALDESKEEIQELQKAVSQITSENKETKQLLVAAEQNSVIDRLTKAAISKAESDVQRRSHAETTKTLETRIEKERSAFCTQRTQLEQQVKVQAQELQQFKAHTASMKQFIQDQRTEHSKELEAVTLEKEKETKQRTTLQHQLDALEERAKCELQKANVDRETAKAEKAQLLAQAVDLEKSIAAEARANADLVAQVAKARDENLKAAVQYQENLQHERERGAQVASEFEDLARRFARREPREQDLEAIDNLRNSVHSERQRAKDLMHHAVQTQRELEHARKIDRIFGPESAANRRQREVYRRMETNQKQQNNTSARPASANISKQRRPSSSSGQRHSSNSKLKLAQNHAFGQSSNQYQSVRPQDV